jgi:DNA-binding protein HU-beta/integration host factor subunit beta
LFEATRDIPDVIAVKNIPDHVFLMYDKERLMATVTKKELVIAVSEKTGAKQSIAKSVVQAFLDQIIEELEKGNKIELRDFAVFNTKMRKARKARNPRTGEEIFAPAKKVVTFKAGRLMRERIK